MAENAIFTILFVVNTIILMLLFKERDEDQRSNVNMVQFEPEDPKPYIIFSKHGVDVTFRNPNVDLNI